jgi:flagellar biosynthetic protein FliR
MVINLSQILSGHVFAFMLVFMRIGGGFMMFLLPEIPPLPGKIGDLVVLMGKELFIGIFFSTILRMVMTMIEIAGALISMQTGLSNAMILNPALAGQSALTSAMLSTAGIVLLFASGLDHLLIRVLMETYTLFPISGPFPLGDATETIVHIMSQSFVIGVQMATPFIVVGLMMYTTMGIMQKMMTQVQLFLVLIPIQIWGGFFLFSVTVGVMLTFWLQAYDEILTSTFAR